MNLTLISRPLKYNTEGYATVQENEFLKATKNPLSTFSIDVDVASYANLRRFLNHGQKPPVDAVRIEEMINYFNYDYPQPKGEDPFSVNTELASCPWNEKHQLVHIGLQGKKIPTDNLPASNLVFLIDVSGSMQDANKLPLLKSAFKMLVEEMREQDRVAIVVYAGAAGLVLPSTPGSEKEKIIQALERLSAGGSTAGGAGIKLAYEVALKNFKKDGNNRIILATDGDFNVGASSNEDMERLIEKKRDEGVFLTVVGFGMGNYKDDKMEILADKGNGNYAYIDNMQEARKVFVNEFGGTLFTIAKDVKLQIEFNPAKVQAYRLIGYENRRLRDEDFNNDKKDAGELGSGHTVTALYEIIPVGVKSDFAQTVDPLKYQKSEEVAPLIAFNSREVLTLKLRYKKPDGDKSKLITTTLLARDKDWEGTSENFRWSAAVAEFGMLLRESKYSQDADIASVIELAKGAMGEDEEGYRREFMRLVASSEFLASRE
jgi:Ca-activated chloride channel family protein